MCLGVKVSKDTVTREFGSQMHLGGHRYNDGVIVPLQIRGVAIVHGRMRALQMFCVMNGTGYCPQPVDLDGNLCHLRGKSGNGIYHICVA